MKHKKTALYYIIPVYNVELYLSTCLESVLHLSLANFEIILIDDGSTDNSGKIADAYAEKDARIHVFHQTNAGLSATRNRGIELAQGTYIAFLDSDDWLMGNQIVDIYHHFTIKRRYGNGKFPFLLSGRKSRQSICPHSSEYYGTDCRRKMLFH